MYDKPRLSGWSRCLLRLWLNLRLCPSNNGDGFCCEHLRVVCCCVLVEVIKAEVLMLPAVRCCRRCSSIVRDVPVNLTTAACLSHPDRRFVADNDWIVTKAIYWQHCTEGGIFWLAYHRLLIIVRASSVLQQYQSYHCYYYYYCCFLRPLHRTACDSWHLRVRTGGCARSVWSFTAHMACLMAA